MTMCATIQHDVTISNVNEMVEANLSKFAGLKVILLHRCFLRFLNCTNEWCQIAQSITGKNSISRERNMTFQ